MKSNKVDFAVKETASTADLLFGCEHNGRFDWVLQQLGPANLFFIQDGTLLRLMAKETIHSFVNGQFIATVLLAFSLIERSIAGRLSAVGEAGIREERCFENLIKRARVKKWVSEHEAQYITEVCGEYRNSLTHFRMPKEPTRHEERVRDAGHQLGEVIEGDARVVLGAAFNILRTTSI